MLLQTRKIIKRNRHRLCFKSGPHSSPCVTIQITERSFYGPGRGLKERAPSCHVYMTGLNLEL